MSYTLPFEPYMTNIVKKYDLYIPSVDPLTFFRYILETYGARATDINMFGSNEWEFDTEEQRTLFILRFES